MIKDLFINFSIVVACLYVYTQIVRKEPLSPSSPLRVKILAGILSGLLSNILMQFSIQIDPVLIDLRQVPSIIVAYFGGGIPALISVILTTTGRYLISLDTASSLSMMVNLFGALFAWYFSTLRYSKQVKMFVIVAVNNTILSVLLVGFIDDGIVLTKVLLIYWISSYVAAYLSFYMLHYIRRSQMLLKKYEQDSMTDGLTGLGNVRKFDDVFNRLILQLEESDQRIALLYIDIDYFKQVNDSYGHLEGDKILKDLGYVLQRSARSNDIICRNGGEEFTVLLVDCSLQEATRIAERIRQNVNDYPFRLSRGQRLTITVSIGIASYRETTLDPVQLIESADSALYKAKTSGRNRICVANKIGIDKENE